MSVTISASLVKTLREKTDAPMMDCKKVLIETGGDLELAIRKIQELGLSKAVKKADRIAAEGFIAVHQAQTPAGPVAVLVEVNCETDFVAREARFRQFGEKVASLVAETGIDSVPALLETAVEGQTLDALRMALIAQIGENISIRRIAYLKADTGVLGAYAHGGANGVRIGAVVALQGGTESLAKDLAMQAAAMNPAYARISDIPATVLADQKLIFVKQTEEEGKAADKVPMIAEGKLKKWAKESSLLGQAFVKDSGQTVEALLKQAGAELIQYVRFEVGEGIEKKTDNFVEEVMAQARGA